MGKHIISLCILVVLVASFAQASRADGCGYKAAGGHVICLATNSAVSANQALTTPWLGIPIKVTVCLSSLYPTTFLIKASLDGTNYYECVK